MSQPCLPFQVQVVPANDKVTARVGLTLVALMLAALGLAKVIKRERRWSKASR